MNEIIYQCNLICLNIFSIYYMYILYIEYYLVLYLPHRLIQVASDGTLIKVGQRDSQLLT